MADAFIGSGPCRGNVESSAHNVQHSTAGGNQPTIIIGLHARPEHRDPLDRGSRREACDDVAGTKRNWVALAGRHHQYGGIISERGWRYRRQVAVGGRRQQGGEV